MKSIKRRRIKRKSKSKRSSTIKKSKYKRRTTIKKSIKKSIKKRQNKKGGAVIGSGAQGCIIDSLSYDQYNKADGYVAKVFPSNININTAVLEKLKEIDPKEERFIQNIVPADSFERDQLDTNADIQECNNINKGKGLPLDKTSNVVFMRKLAPLDTQQMTKAQYRYLHESIKILRQNNILHGDLPGNIMLDNSPTHVQNPIIIDWENAILNPEPIVENIDINAFLTSGNFKTIKK
jgi:hypothetical protein